MRLRWYRIYLGASMECCGSRVQTMDSIRIMAYKTKEKKTIGIHENKGKKTETFMLFFRVFFFCIFRAFSASRHCIYGPLVCLYDVRARARARARAYICVCLSVCIFPYLRNVCPKKYQIRPFKTNTKNTHTRTLWKCVRYEFEYS